MSESKVTQEEPTAIRTLKLPAIGGVVVPDKDWETLKEIIAEWREMKRLGAHYDGPFRG